MNSIVILSKSSASPDDTSMHVATPASDHFVQLSPLMARRTHLGEQTV